MSALIQLAKEKRADICYDCNTIFLLPHRPEEGAAGGGGVQGRNAEGRWTDGEPELDKRPFSRSMTYAEVS